MTNVNIDVARLSEEAKTAILSSMSRDIAFAQDDVNYFRAELERKVQVIEEMDRMIGGLRKQLASAISDKNSIAVDLRIERARAQQPKRDFHAESVESLVQLEAPHLLAFIKAVEEGRHGDAMEIVPPALYKRIKDIPTAKKIERIMVLRQTMCGLGLKEAKDFVDTFCAWEAALNL